MKTTKTQILKTAKETAKNTTFSQKSPYMSLTKAKTNRIRYSHFFSGAGQTHTRVTPR
jgi:hypothetical protein